MSHKNKSSSHIQPRLDLDDIEQTSEILDNKLSPDVDAVQTEVVHAEGKKINQKTQRIVGIMFFMLIAFLIVPQFMQGPPKIPVVTPVPKEPNIDTARPSVTIQVNQEGNIVPANLGSSILASQDPVHSSLNANSSGGVPSTANTPNSPNTPSIPNSPNSPSIPNSPNSPNSPIDSTDLANVKNTNPVLEPISTEMTVIEPIVVPKQVLETQVKSKVKPEKVRSIVKSSSKLDAAAKQVAKPIKSVAPKLPIISLLSTSQSGKNVKINTSNSVQTKKGSYHIQTGVFSKEKNASDEHRKLNAAGFPVAILRSGSQFKVRIGPFGDEKSAKSMMSRLKSSGYATALIRP